MRRVFTGELIIQHSYGIFVHITWSEIAECMDSISVYQFPIFVFIALYDFRISDILSPTVLPERVGCLRHDGIQGIIFGSSVL